MCIKTYEKQKCFPIFLLFLQLEGFPLQTSKVEVNEYRRTYECSGLVYILYLVEHLSGSLCSVPVVKYGASQNLLSLGASQCN